MRTRVFFFVSFAMAQSMTPLLARSADAPKASWKVTRSISAPESAYYDRDSGFIFVSNVAGTPLEKDGKGWISKLTLGGKIVRSKWIDGFHAPKGLRARKGILWVSDIDQVVSIDLKKRKILRRIPIPGSKFLNDIAIGDEGDVFVSDTLSSRIYRIHEGAPSVWMEGPELEAPNGLLVKDGFLYVAAWGIPEADWTTKVPGHLYKINLQTKEKTLLTPKPLGNLDGLEMDSDGSFLVSDWMAGKVFRVTSAGVSTVILSEVKNSADIGFLPKRRLLLVPAMGGNEVSAFKLK